MSSLPLQAEWDKFRACRPVWETLRKKADELRNEEGLRYSVERAKIKNDAERLRHEAAFQWYAAVHRHYGNVHYQWAHGHHFYIFETGDCYPDS